MITEIQKAILEQKLDGWLFFDHHQRDPLAYQILGLNKSLKPSRRWYYFIPAHGEPRKLVHRIESQVIDDLPGEKELYSSWREQHAKLNALLTGSRQVAMQYSPNCAIPYVSMLDGGTLDLVRHSGVEVVTSADLVQQFEACWSTSQLQAHIEAGKRVDRIRREAFALVDEKLRNGHPINEREVQLFILTRFEAEGLYTDHGPIVAVNDNASNPHYEPTASHFRQIRTNDVLLIDLWAKLDIPDSVYYDVTWTGFCGNTIPSEVLNVFQIVKGARKAASDFVSTRTCNRLPLSGWEVDDAARNFIGKHGLSEFFVHRTGHSIGQEVHGNGANMDNFESHDDRKVIPNTCFSIEPGIYLPEFGIRSEVNVFVEERRAWVTGEEQESLVHILG